MSVEAITVRHGDTHPIYWQIKDKAGAVVDLAGATARLNVEGTKPKSSAQTLVAVVEYGQNRIRHDLLGTLAVGTYAYEIEITKAGVISTAPTKENGVLIVLDDIA